MTKVKNSTVDKYIKKVLSQIANQKVLTCTCGARNTSVKKREFLVVGGVTKFGPMCDHCWNKEVYDLL